MKKVALLGAFAIALIFGTQAMLVACADAQTTQNSWQGLYLGANMGAARNHDTGVVSCINPAGTVNGAGCPVPTYGTSVGHGGIAGLQLGYNLQFNRIIVGAEVDSQIASLQSISTLNNGTLNTIGGGPSTPGVNYVATSNLTTLNTERLRIGFATPKTLVFVSGGVAQSIENVQQAYSGALVTLTYPMNTTVRQNGFAESIGGEWAMTPRFSVKLEAMSFYLRNAVPYVFSAPGVTSGFQTGKDFEFHGALIRAGFNWKV